MPEKLKPYADDWEVGEAITKPCFHARPQDKSQLHGVCIFCWRDRCAVLAAAVRRPEPGRCETCKWWVKMHEVSTARHCSCQRSHSYMGYPPKTHGCIFHAPPCTN